MVAATRDANARTQAPCLGCASNEDAQQSFNVTASDPAAAHCPAGGSQPR